VLSFAVLTWIMPSGGGAGILDDVARDPQRTSKGIPGSATAPPAGLARCATAMAALLAAS
jgi:hypothetical protein